MKGHLYRITVEHLTTAKGETVDKAPLVFETTNHDDLLSIVARMQTRKDLPLEDAAPLAIGLKLFSEIALKHRREPLFEGVMESIGTFIGRLKGARKQEAPHGVH